MTARILDGKRIAEALLDDLAIRVEARVAAGLPRPGLAVVLVGEDQASAVYVRNKRKACRKVGIEAYDYDLPAGTSQEELASLAGTTRPTANRALQPLVTGGIVGLSRGQIVVHNVQRLPST